MVPGYLGLLSTAEGPGGGAEATYHVCHPAGLEQYVLLAGGQAEVVSPPEVRVRVEAAGVRAPELDTFARGRKLVGWNPHFDLRPNGTRFGEGFSTFTGWWRVIVGEFARRHASLALVIRPHPLLFGPLPARAKVVDARGHDLIALPL